MTHPTRLFAATAPAALLAALIATAGCNRERAGDNTQAQARFALPALPATLPLEAGPARDPAPAPSASDLSDAPPLKLARVADPAQAYGYADAASGYDEALGDAPPDYGFGYDDADQYAWQGTDDSLMVAEPIDDGYRTYYYRPGAAEPYFVRDPYYSYGFASGLLAVVYGADGAIVPYADYGPRLAYASRYYARGRQLWGASRQGRRRAVIAATWVRQRPVLLAARARWDAGRVQQPEWRRYAEANRPRQTAYWQAEQVRRQADARRFEGWQAQGFRSAPPPRAIPVAWEKAAWAKDDRRYRPAVAATLRDRPERARLADRPRADRPPTQPEPAREQARLDARQAQQVERREAVVARREQAAPIDRPQTRAVDRQAARAERQVERAQPPRAEARQAQAAERRQQQAERAQHQQAQATQRQQAESDRAQRQPAQQAGRQQAQRQEAQTAQRQQAQAERSQRQQAQQAERQQALAAQRQQAQVQRQQAQQAERQQAQAAQRQQAQQAQQAQRQQAQAERQQALQAQRQQQAERAPPRAPRAEPPAPRPAPPQRQPRPARPNGPGPN